MLDSNGANTTAAAAVALMLAGCGDGNGRGGAPLAGQSAVVLAGTGPVGQRIAGLLARAGASVRLSSRALDRAKAAAERVAERFEAPCEPVAVRDEDSLAGALAGSRIAVATGAAGVRLLPEAVWREHHTLEVLADPGTAPPSGIEGIEPFDRGEARHGKRTYGGLAIGSLKLRLHRACIARLFERNDQILDVEEIYALARTLVG